VADTKRVLGLDPEVEFAVDEDALTHARAVSARGREAHHRWQSAFDDWRLASPDLARLEERMRARRLPDGWESALPSFEAGTSLATRAASGKVLAAVAPELPELWGGSADLAGSNNTSIPGAPSALPAERQTDAWSGTRYGRILHFGVREHAMGGIANGIVLEGHTRPYVGTFLVFSDYMRPAVRLAALMGLPTIYVWTHDSIGVGEDGPTHQPIEHLAALRAIPGLAVVRPADANETVWAWQAALEQQSGPVALALTRQNVPVLPGTEAGLARDGVRRGGYVLADAPSAPEVVLMATGSEVQLALGAQRALAGAGVAARVVSMPCLEWFADQPQAYRDQVLPPDVRARVAVEAGVPLSWYRWVGDAGRIVGLDHFGASADQETLFRQFGLTVESVVAAAHASLEVTR
jgi:transketolase